MIRGAIAQAARATDVDFRFLLAQAKVESGLDPTARARGSSATGLFQFIESTWLDVMRRHGPALGLTQQASASRDPAMRSQILALRNNPHIASLMAGALAQDNRAALTPVLGREADAGELYLAHFLGAEGAARFLTAMEHSPQRPAAELFGTAAAANRSIFYEQGGKARSMSGVMAVLRGRIEVAMAGEGTPEGPTTPSFTEGFRLAAPEFARSGGLQGAIFPVADSAGNGAARPPITAVLRDSFALGGFDKASGAGEHARRAYARLKAFGL